jgi:hypothetical protein
MRRPTTLPLCSARPRRAAQWSVARYCPELALFRKTGGVGATKRGRPPHVLFYETNPIGDIVRDTIAGDPADGPLRADPFARACATNSRTARSKCGTFLLCMGMTPDGRVTRPFTSDGGINSRAGGVAARCTRSAENAARWLLRHAAPRSAALCAAFEKRMADRHVRFDYCPGRNRALVKVWRRRRAAASVPPEPEWRSARLTMLPSGYSYGIR